MTIKQLIGNYESFFSDLLFRLKKANIAVDGMPISHFQYRTTTTPEFYDHSLRDIVVLQGWTIEKIINF